MKRMLVALVAASIGIGLPMAVMPRLASAVPPISVGDSSKGKVLVDENKMTLYIFARDSENTSACAGACLQRWIPLEATAEEQGDGDFKIIVRKDGLKQWTYKGQPLYLYDGDENPGETKGDGMGGAWSVARP